MPISIVQSENILTGLSNVKQIVAVASGKGGVGKSTIAVHLAAAFNHLGKKVGLLDADLYGPSIRRMFQEASFPIEKEGKFTPAYSRSGIALMTLAYFRSQESPGAFRAPIANQLIHSFLKDVDWGSLDYLFIDFPPGTGDIPLTLTQAMPKIAAILVTTPQEISLLDVQKALGLFKIVHLPVLGIIENMSYFSLPQSMERHAVFGEGGGRRFALEHSLPFLGEIPLDPSLAQAGDRGLPLIEEKPSSKISLLFLDIAKRLIET